MKYGLYEQIINLKIKENISIISDRYKQIESIDKAEASKVLSVYVGDVVRKALDDIGNDKIEDKINLVNKIVHTIQNERQEAYYNKLTIDEAELLYALLADKDPRASATDRKLSIVRPETSLAHSSLFTGAVREPQMYLELKKEAASADRIDMLVSFVKWSGLRLIIDSLKDFVAKGGRLRIITTSYMGATDAKAIDELCKLPNTQIKISYDTKITRLHAKAYIFYRETGFTTAYVGSSNLSNAAISSGLEWNLKIARKDLPETIDKIEASFESYWNSKDFEFYTEVEQERLKRALKAEKYYDNHDNYKYVVDVIPYSYQQEILDKLQAERKIHNHYRNLIVAATGTGKTVISALDYKNFIKENKNSGNRLLFVAHREEILTQSIATFRAVLKDNNFGELFTGKYKPDTIDNLFVSVQTVNSQNLPDKIRDNYYDYIVIDEFHHAAAPTYQKLLNYFKPKILLGLTATPERMDGKSVIKYFDNRIAAEIRLPEAIDRKLLCPFQYFGITDSVDLQRVKWSRGGYDRKELSNIYTINSVYAKKRANDIIINLYKYITDINEVKGLGFCVSIEHAKFMCEHFNQNNIPSIFLTGESPDGERNSAKNKLINGNIRFIFVVDIYNEGVDIPEVNTVLFLRPTESLTIFLQQLGRGLRLSENKDCLTVLDFIGQAHKKYNFENKFGALLSGSRQNIVEEIKKGFVSVPKGCYIQLEKIAAKYILDNIKSSYSGKISLINRVMTFEDDTGLPLSFANFLNYYNYDPRLIYKYSTFSDICVEAKIISNYNEPLKDIIQNGLLRFSSTNSRRFIKFIIKLIKNIKTINLNDLSDIEMRMLRMFYVTIWTDHKGKLQISDMENNLKTIAESPVIAGEMVTFFEYLYEKIDFIDEEINLGFACPLDLHCNYTRDQILLGYDYFNTSAVRQGVINIKDKFADIFFVTLNKSEKDYSPTTMYEDYSINEYLFHWQSQSTTSDTSATGQRYINHKKMNSKILLFVREFDSDKLTGKPEAFTFLGTAQYVSHTGSRPMSITWRLDKPIPAKFIKKSSKLLVG